MKIWETQYNGHQIRVENSWFGGEKLIVDGELQDQQIGLASRSRLYGRIKSGTSEGEKIKVSIGALFTVGCRIFVDDKLIFPEESAT